MRGAKPARIQEVAARAGVSAMTVSLALRSEPDPTRMSSETRARVLEAAKELNYAPNARARALRLGRTNVLGLYAGHGFINVRTPYFNELVSGLQEACELIHKDLLLHGVFHGTSPQEIYSALADGRIDGLILNVPPTDPLVEMIRNGGFRAIAVADPVLDIPTVMVDDASGAKLIARHFAAGGHRRVVFGMSSTQPLSAIRRRDAFLEACAELGIEALVLAKTEDGREREFLAEVLSTHSSAIAAWNDDLAHSILNECRRSGIRVPERLAIAGFDGCPMPYGLANPITTISAPWSDVAKTAALSLDSILRGESVPSITVLPVRFMKGSTT